MILIKKQNVGMYYVLYVPMLKICKKPTARKEIDKYVRMEKQTPVLAHKKQN